MLWKTLWITGLVTAPVAQILSVHFPATPCPHVINVTRWWTRWKGGLELTIHRSTIILFFCLSKNLELACRLRRNKSIVHDRSRSRHADWMSTASLSLPLYNIGCVCVCFFFLPTLGLGWHNSKSIVNFFIPDHPFYETRSKALPSLDGLSLSLSVSPIYIYLCQIKYYGFPLGVDTLVLDRREAVATEW